MLCKIEVVGDEDEIDDVNINIKNSSNNNIITNGHHIYVNNNQLKYENDNLKNYNIDYLLKRIKYFQF